MMTYKEAMHKARRDYLHELYAEAYGKTEAAAVISGLNRTHLYKIIKQHAPEVLTMAQADRAKRREAHRQYRLANPVNWQW